MQGRNRFFNLCLKQSRCKGGEEKLKVERNQNQSGTHPHLGDTSRVIINNFPFYNYVLYD